MTLVLRTVFLLLNLRIGDVMVNISIVRLAVEELNASQREFMLGPLFDWVGLFEVLCFSAERFLLFVKRRSGLRARF